MSRIVILEQRCKGCLLCAAHCPRKLLRKSERFNAKGYQVAEVVPENADDCTGCACCATVCPDMAVRVFRKAPAKTAAQGDAR